MYCLPSREVSALLRLEERAPVVNDGTTIWVQCRVELRPILNRVDAEAGAGLLRWRSVRRVA